MYLSFLLTPFSMCFITVKQVTRFLMENATGRSAVPEDAQRQKVPVTSGQAADWQEKHVRVT